MEEPHNDEIFLLDRSALVENGRFAVPNTDLGVVFMTMIVQQSSVYREQYSTVLYIKFFGTL